MRTNEHKKKAATKQNQFQFQSINEHRMKPLWGKTEMDGSERYGCGEIVRRQVFNFIVTLSIV